MKYFFTAIFVFLILVEFVFSANASMTIRYPIKDIQGLKQNPNTEKIVLVFSVLYPNGCYVSKFNIDLINYEENIIYLVHFTHVRDGLCTMALVTKLNHFEMFKPTEGEYQLIDSVTYKKLGTLTVSENGSYLTDTDSGNLQ